MPPLPRMSALRSSWKRTRRPVALAATAAAAATGIERETLPPKAPPMRRHTAQDSGSSDAEYHRFKCKYSKYGVVRSFGKVNRSHETGLA